MAALAVTGLGLVASAVVLVRTALLLPALAVLMEMLTAAGLLRLAAAPTYSRALGAGGVLLTRRLVVLGLTAGRAPVTTGAAPDRPPPSR